MTKGFSDIIVESKERDGDTIYLITPASKEEIEIGHFIEISGMKLSGNAKKHAVIRNVKMSE